MRENFLSGLNAVLRHEGGYVNHPRDPGGATNKGVTQRVYDDWRRSQGMDPRSVRSITGDETAAIYRKLYWDAVRGDDLPSGVDYCIFDFAVNSGHTRASKCLQLAVGAAPDGKIGPATLAAVRVADPRRLINEVCSTREAFLRGLPTFDTFGKGWIRRVTDVEMMARGMCA